MSTQISAAHVSQILGRREKRSIKTPVPGGKHQITPGFRVRNPAEFHKDHGTEVYVEYLHGSGSLNLRAYLDESPEDRDARLQRYAVTLLLAGYQAEVKGERVVVTKAVQA